MPSYLDLGVIGIILVSALLSMMRGFTREVLAIGSWAAAAAAAYYFYPLVLPYVAPYVHKDIIAQAIAAALVFFATLIVVSLFTVRISDAILDSKIGALDRSLGFLFGAARGFLLAVVAFAIFNWLVAEKLQPVWVKTAKTRPILMDSATAAGGAAARGRRRDGRRLAEIEGRRRSDRRAAGRERPAARRRGAGSRSGPRRSRARCSRPGPGQDRRGPGLGRHRDRQAEARRDHQQGGAAARSGAAGDRAQELTRRRRAPRPGRRLGRAGAISRRTQVFRSGLGRLRSPRSGPEDFRPCGRGVGDFGLPIRESEP